MAGGGGNIRCVSKNLEFKDGDQTDARSQRRVVKDSGRGLPRTSANQRSRCQLWASCYMREGDFDRWQIKSPCGHY